MDITNINITHNTEIYKDVQHSPTNITQKYIMATSPKNIAQKYIKMSNMDTIYNGHHQKT